MKAKITAQVLATLPDAGSNPYEVNDTELRGFQLRVGKSQTRTYQCVYRLRDSGCRHRYILGRSPALTPAQARDEARKILGDVARGIDPNAARRARRKEARKPTLLTFLDDHYAPWAGTHLGTADKTVARIKRAFTWFSQKRLDSLTSWQLDKWKSDQLKAGLSPLTVNRELAALRAVLTKAVEWDLLPEHPLRRVKQLKVDDDHRVRYLTDTEEQRLFGALDARDDLARDKRAKHARWLEERGFAPVPLIKEAEFIDHLRPMILLSMNTGLRRGELFKLKCSDIDIGRRQLKVRAAAAKSGRSRHVPLNDEAFEVIERWLLQRVGQADDLVFPGKDGRPLTDLSSAWERLRKAAQLTDFRWHDLRHHFASRLVMAGVDLNTVRELLGHADLKMTLRYAHLAPEHKAQAVAKLVRSAGGRK